MKKSSAAALKGYRGRVGPDWRWKLAEAIVRSSSRPHPYAGADRVVDRLAQFLQLMHDEDPERAAQQHPRVAEAVARWDDVDTKSLVTLFVLGDVAVEQIARRLATSTEVIQTMEQVFLDIRDQREATSWLHTRVIWPASRAGRFAAVQYCAAFRGGPAVAEAIADGLNGGALATLHDIGNLEAALFIKMQVALLAPLDNGQERQKFKRLYLQHVLDTQKLELDRERFRHRCEIDRQKLALDQARHEAAAERQAQREQERQRRGAEQARRQAEQRRSEELQQYLRRQASVDRQEAALARAASSPLARLSWAGCQVAHDRPIVPSRTGQHIADERRKVA